MSWDFLVSQLARLETKENFAVLVLSFVLLFFFVLHALSEWLQFRRQGIHYFKSIWNLFDLCLIVVRACVLGPPARPPAVIRSFARVLRVPEHALVRQLWPPARAHRRARARSSPA